MSEHEVPVVRIGHVEKHSNADTLSLTEVEGCPVVIRTSDFKEGDLAIYLPVESLVPEDRNWVKIHCSHLKFKANGFHRLKAARLRGVFSMGMLVPFTALQGAKKIYNVGDDVAEELGVGYYVEPEDIIQEPGKPKTRWGRFKSWLRRVLHLNKKQKPRLMPVYEVGHYRKNKRALEIGEEIVLTEKIHGSNSAISFTKGKLWVSSHRVLRTVEDNSIWWQIARYYNLKEILSKKPDFAFYGEIYGSGVQDMSYDIPVGQLRIAFFDILDMTEKRFLSYDEALKIFRELGLAPVPEIYRGPYNPAIVEPLADGKSLIASHFREGVVIRPVSERRNMAVGRVVLKLIGETYMLRPKGTERH